MDDDFILIYFTEGRYAGFQRRHIKYFSSFMFLQAYLNRRNNISKYYIYQRIDTYPIGKQQTL